MTNFNELSYFEGLKELDSFRLEIIKEVSSEYITILNSIVNKNEIIPILNTKKDIDDCIVTITGGKFIKDIFKANEYSSSIYPNKEYTIINRIEKLLNF